MPTQYEIGVIGAGNAAEGIIHGVSRNSVLLDDRSSASDPNPKRRQDFKQRFGVATADDNRHVVQTQPRPVAGREAAALFEQSVAGVTASFQRSRRLGTKEPLLTIFAQKLPIPRNR